MQLPDTVISIILWLTGGLGLFLFGVDVLSDGLREIAGGGLRRIVARGTRVPFIGMGIGAIMTAVLQSSSASTVLIVSLVDAGLLSLKQSAGLIFGTGIGSTVTAQIITFKWVSMAALPMIGAGFFIRMLAKKDRLSQIGTILLGFGMLFFGFEVMKAAVEPWQEGVIREWLQVQYAPTFLSMLFIALVAAFATAIVQSSAAVIGLVMVLATQGIITDFEMAMPMIVGANIGTTITAVLASIGGTVTAKRAAGLHVLFRLAAGAITIAAFSLYARFIPGTSDDISRQIANFHTLQNLFAALILLSLTGGMVWVVKKIIRGKDEYNPAPAYLDFGADLNSEEMVEQARLEAIRMIRMSRDMNADVIAAFYAGNYSGISSVLKREEVLDGLHDAVIQFMIPGGKQNKKHKYSHKMVRVLEVVHHIERVGDHAENLVELTGMHADSSLTFDKKHMDDIRDIWVAVDKLADLAEQALETDNEGLADEAGYYRQRIKTEVAGLLVRRHKAVEEEGYSAISAVMYEDFLSNLQSASSHYKKAIRSWFGLVSQSSSE